MRFPQISCCCFTVATTDNATCQAALLEWKKSRRAVAATVKVVQLVLNERYEIFRGPSPNADLALEIIGTEYIHKRWGGRL